MTTTARLHRNRIAVWILAALFAFGGIAEAGSAVLCVSGDGHADVEYSLAGCCVGISSSGDQTGPLALLSDTPGCDDCVDLCLEQGSLKAGKKFLPGPHMTTFREFSADRESGATGPFATTELIVHDSLVAEISSVVLLI